MTSDERRSGNALAAALVCLVTVVAFETMSVATVMPKVLDDLGGLNVYGWAFSGLALGEVMGIVIAGMWCDRANPARPIIVGLSVYVAGLVVSGLAPSMMIVVAGRVLQGFGSGTVPAVAYVSVGRGFAESERPRVFAWMSTAWVVPAMVGPSAAGALAQAVGWRWVFLGLIPVVVGVGALAVAPIRRLGSPVRDSIDEAGAAVRTIRLALAAVLGTAVALGALQFRSPAAMAVGLAVGLAVLGSAFVRIAPAGTLTLRRGVPATVAARGLLTCSFLGADAFVALALNRVRHMSIRDAGIVLSSAAITWTIGSWYSARRIESVGPRRLIVGGFGFVIAGIGAMAAVISTDVNPWWAIGAWMVGGLGIGLAYAPLTQAVISSSDPSRIGAATSALQLSDVLGFALGTGLGGALVEFADRYGWTVSSASVASASDSSVAASSVLAGVLAVFAFTAAAGVVGTVAAGRVDRWLGGTSAPAGHM